MRRSRHKHVDSTHILIVPRLFTPYWRRHLNKVADIVLTIPAGHPSWPKEMLEPLTLGIVFPFVNHSPWSLQRCPFLLEMGKLLSELWATNPGAEGPVLRELWHFPERLASLSARLARKVLRGRPTSSLPSGSARKRRRGGMEEDEGRGKVPRGA